MAVPYGKKLKFWIIHQKNAYEGNCYNLVAKTRKEVVDNAKRWEEGADSDTWEDTVYQVQVKYTDAYDLFEFLTSEGRSRHKDIGDVLSKYKWK